MSCAMCVVQILVKSVMPNSQAWLAGLRENDVIVKINGESTGKMSNESFNRQLTTNKYVQLQIQRMTTASTDASYSAVCIAYHPVCNACTVI